MSVLGVGALCIAFATHAQVETQTKVTHGAPTKTVKVERGTVVYVSGNNLVVKAEDGSLRHFDNVPEATTVTVDGKQLNVHQLKPGMTVEKQTITTSTPRMITTVQTVTGTVWQVSPPNSVILTLEDGKNQRFKIPKGQKFTIDGQETDAFGLRPGMKVTAQKVVEQPETVVTQQVKRTGVMPPPPPAPAPEVPILVVFMEEAPAPAEQAAAAPAPAPKKQLPKTGSELPLIGLLGMLSVGLSLGLKALRNLNAGSRK
jgi:LPXTG-motif cell wall-anchored protein